MDMTEDTRTAAERHKRGAEIWRRISGGKPFQSAADMVALGDELGLVADDERFDLAWFVTIEGEGWTSEQMNEALAEREAYVFGAAGVASFINEAGQQFGHEVGPDDAFAAEYGANSVLPANGKHAALAPYLPKPLTVEGLRARLQQSMRATDDERCLDPVLRKRVLLRHLAPGDSFTLGRPGMVALSRAGAETLMLQATGGGTADSFAIFAAVADTTALEWLKAATRSNEQLSIHFPGMAPLSGYVIASYEWNAVPFGGPDVSIEMQRLVPAAQVIAQLFEPQKATTMLHRPFKDKIPEPAGTDATAEPDRKLPQVREGMAVEDGFPVFWWGSYSLSGFVGSFEDLKTIVACSNRTLAEVLAARTHDNDSDFVSLGLIHRSFGLIPGLHTGEETLREFLTEEGAALPDESNGLTSPHTGMVLDTEEVKGHMLTVEYTPPDIERYLTDEPAAGDTP